MLKLHHLFLVLSVSVVSESVSLLLLSVLVSVSSSPERLCCRLESQSCLRLGSGCLRYHCLGFLASGCLRCPHRCLGSGYPHFRYLDSLGLDFLVSGCLHYLRYHCLGSLGLRFLASLEYLRYQ